MVISVQIAVFEKKIVLGRDLRLNFIATDERRKMLNTVDDSLSAKHLRLEYFSSINYSFRNYIFFDINKIKPTKRNKSFEFNLLSFSLLRYLFFLTLSFI